MSDIFIDFDKKNEFLKVSMDKIKSCGKEVAEIAARRIINGETDFGIEKIAKDILERKDNSMAIEFTKVIGELLKKNGVSVKITEYEKENHSTNKFEVLYGCSIDELDFSEHDKVFENKIAKLEENIGYYKDSFYRTEKNCDKLYNENQELKQRISELESMEMENFSEIDTSNPLACAESLIEHMTHCEKFMIMPERNVQTFSVEELKEIADYLMVYYKHHKDRDAEDTISF